jgi:hypothetical protein
MKAKQSGALKGALPALIAIVLAGMLSSSPLLQADDTKEEALIQRGFEISPVPLNLAGKNRDLVGLGSYLVNARSDCNSCHNSGGPPNFDFANNQNPYFGQPKKVDPNVYLGGGQDFGQGGPPNNPGPHIVSRNLTPDKTGRPEGGHSLSDFLTIMKTGKDFDHLHPTCTGRVTTNCIPAPVDGDLLQIMPWPTFQNMTDHDLEAIYEYLSAIPCLDTKIAGQPQLRNQCR